TFSFGRWRSSMRRKIGVAGQWFGGLLCLAGIIIEIILRAEVGYILITSGAVIFAIATKLRYGK
ncbi:MAG: hypothetical protein QMC90_02595, partial [Dehalococcoidales bacterium]|nr:hypothetical protein [Dehalococcoidales bacterium]